MISCCNSQAEWMERAKQNDASQYASNQGESDAGSRTPRRSSGKWFTQVLHSPNEENAHPVTKYQNTEKTAVCHINLVVNAPQIAMPGVRVRARTLIH